jgi:hypothetical protein
MSSVLMSFKHKKRKRNLKMSDLENTKIYEAAYEDFDDLIATSESFLRLVIQGMIEGGLLSKGELFQKLWENDAELLISDKRTAVEAYIMFRKSMNHFEKIGADHTKTLATINVFQKHCREKENDLDE